MTWLFHFSNILLNFILSVDGEKKQAAGTYECILRLVIKRWKLKSSELISNVDIEHFMEWNVWVLSGLVMLFDSFWKFQWEKMHFFGIGIKLYWNYFMTFWNSEVWPDTANYQDLFVLSCIWLLWNYFDWNQLNSKRTKKNLLKIM